MLSVSAWRMPKTCTYGCKGEEDRTSYRKKEIKGTEFDREKFTDTVIYVVCKIERHGNNGQQRLDLSRWHFANRILIVSTDKIRVFLLSPGVIFAVLMPKE